jgi:non-canonical (house-cleaning) NTP pyrophosphatase
MKIALGTTSTTKLEILERTLKQIGLSDFQIVPCKADSEITAQPLGEEATLLGSINRAKNSIKLHPEADIGIGLEGGLPLVRNHYYFVLLPGLTG